MYIYILLYYINRCKYWGLNSETCKMFSPISGISTLRGLHRLLFSTGKSAVKVPGQRATRPHRLHHLERWRVGGWASRCLRGHDVTLGPPGASPWGCLHLFRGHDKVDANRGMIWYDDISWWWGHDEHFFELWTSPIWESCPHVSRIPVPLHSRSCRLFIPEHLRELFKEEKEPAMGPVGMVLGRAPLTPLENLRFGDVTWDP